MKSKIFVSRIECYPLFRYLDEFIIIKRNTDEALMPIEAMHIKTREIYGFEEGELAECH